MGRGLKFARDDAMKIIQVSPRFPPNIGGVEHHVASISERMAGLGHEVTIFTLDKSKNTPDTSRENGVEIRRFSYSNLPKFIYAILQTPRDVLHVHNYHSPIPLLLSTLCRGTKRFFVTSHYHGVGSTTHTNILLSLYKPFGSWCLSRAKSVIAVSDWEKNLLSNEFKIQPTLIPNGIDPSPFQQPPFEHEGRPYILCVGRLEPYKGFQHVIRAMQFLPDHDLVIVGSGNYMPSLVDIATRSGVQNQVIFMNNLSISKLAQMYSGATAHVALSTHESYGLTIGESLLSGTPCLVRKSGALGDWAGHQGCLSTDETEPKILSNLIQECFSLTPSYTQPTTWDDVVKSLLDLYSNE